MDNPEVMASPDTKVGGMASERAFVPDGIEPQSVSPVPASIPDARILIFADDPERKPRLYACPKCGTAHSPAIYLAREEVAHEAARQAAENCYTCKTHDTCKHCGCETPKGWLTCESCRHEQALEKAEDVPAGDGPYCAFGDEKYYSELEDAHEDGLEWVSPCNIEYPRLNGDDILDSLLSDMHEDADIDDLRGVDEFLAAVRTFNEAQTTQSWWPDSKRKINVAQAMAARSGETSGSTEGNSAVPNGNAPTPPPISPLQPTPPAEGAEHDH